MFSEIVRAKIDRKREKANCYAQTKTEARKQCASSQCYYYYCSSSAAAAASNGDDGVRLSSVVPSSHERGLHAAGQRISSAQDLTTSSIRCARKRKKPRRKRRERTTKTTNTTTIATSKRGYEAAIWLLANVLLFFASSQASVGQRPVRQTNAANWRLLPSAHDQQVPYQTFYVSHACEWKSNLFVPKSNDILFAQPTSTSNQQQYESVSSNTNEADPTGVRTQHAQTSDEMRTVVQAQPTNANVILSTASKALVLALWPSAPDNFNGFEQACSIRLVVPKNMRILAKLSVRKLTLDDEHTEQQVLVPGGHDFVRPELVRALWLNVSSQSEFSETEHRTLETEGNVLAFRFLLERFAAKREPEMRFQVVLTAFQTLAENEGLNLNSAPNGANPFAGAGDNLNQNAQFICDSQRLISANLACDGYKNCQDGHDEEPATCLAAATATVPSNEPPDARHQSTGATPTARPKWSRTQQVQHNQQQAQADEAGLVARALKQLQAAADGGSLAGFLLGFIFVLLLLACCSCCLYCCLVLWRRHLAGLLSETWPTMSSDDVDTKGRRRRLRARPQGLAASSSSAAELLAAERQNQDNAARLEALGGASATKNIDEPRLQSILRSAAPLARFETLRSVDKFAPVETNVSQPIGDTGLPPAPPPRRGALASSLTSANAGKRRFVPPEPARRRSRPFEAKAAYERQDMARDSEREQKQHQQPQQPQLPQTHKQMSFSTQATRVEQSSSTRRRASGEQRTTSYVYSRDTAHYSESYLLARGNVSAAPPVRDYANLDQVITRPPTNNEDRIDDDDAAMTSGRHKQSALI